MKKFYRKFINAVENLAVKIETIKHYIFEIYNIYRKSNLYRHIKWTKLQQEEFDEFWKNNYGKKISNRWHKLYEACNGVHRIDYFPEFLYSTKLEKKFNDYNYCKVFSNKSLNDVLFENRIENVIAPKYFLFNNQGIYYDNKRNLISLNEAINILQNAGEVVIKPTVGTSSGVGVKILNLKNGVNVRDNRKIEDIISEYKINFIVQEKIKPHNELAKLYPKAINTVRIITYILGDEIGVAPVSLRIGGGGGEVDNIHAGGMVISVTDEGELGKLAYRLGWGDSFETFDKHPDTNVVFENYNLSFIPKMIETAKILHTKTSNIGIISWDFTMNDEEKIVVVEANYSGQSAWFPQMISGNSFFGDNTEKILNFLRKG